MPIVESKYRGTPEYNKAYEKLKDVARARATISYTEVADIMGINPHNPHIGAIMGRIVGAMSEDEHNQHRPMLSAVVVNQAGENAGKPGPGFLELAEQLGGLRDWPAKRNRIFGKRNSMQFMMHIVKTNHNKPREPLFLKKTGFFSYSLI